MQINEPQTVNIQNFHYFNEFAQENANVRKEITKWNKNMMLRFIANKQIQRGEKRNGEQEEILDLQIQVQPTIIPPLQCLPQVNIRCLPSIVDFDNSSLSKSHTALYQRFFNYVYFLIDQRGSTLWESFENCYKEIMGCGGQLANMGEMGEDNNQLYDKIKIFCDEGMQVKIIVASANDKFNAKFLYLFSKQNIIEVKIDGKLPKTQYHDKIQYHDISQYFQKVVKNEINKSCKIQRAFYNFLNIESNSAELHQKKSCIQKSIQPASKSQILENLQEFIDFLKKYKNKKIAKDIKEQQGKKFPNKQVLSQLKRRQQRMWRQQTSMLKQLRQYVSHYYKYNTRIQVGNEGRDSWDCSDEVFQNIFLLIFKMYIDETSIYEIVNNTLRLSFGINERIMKVISSYVRFLNESIKWFFQTNIKKFKGQNYEYIYRGSMISQNQLKQLKPDQLLFNLGFMSTSTSQQTAKVFQKQITDSEKGINFLFKIKLNENYAQQQFLSNQRGFVFVRYVQQMQKQAGAIPNINQNEVLLNPFNIFRVISVNKNERILELQYAPHLDILKKIKHGHFISQQQKEKYQKPLEHIYDFQRQSFDMGEQYLNKGNPKQSLEYYEELEIQNNTILSPKQNQNFLRVSKETQQYKKMEETLSKIASTVASFEQKQVLNPVQIHLIRQQSQLLQYTEKFKEGGEVADKASRKSLVSLKKIFENDKVTSSLFQGGSSKKSKIQQSALMQKSQITTKKQGIFQTQIQFQKILTQLQSHLAIEIQKGRSKLQLKQLTSCLEVGYICLHFIQEYIQFFIDGVETWIIREFDGVWQGVSLEIKGLLEKVLGEAKEKSFEDSYEMLKKKMEEIFEIKENMDRKAHKQSDEIYREQLVKKILKFMQVQLLEERFYRYFRILVKQRFFSMGTQMNYLDSSIQAFKEKMLLTIQNISKILSTLTDSIKTVKLSVREFYELKQKFFYTKRMHEQIIPYMPEKMRIKEECLEIVFFVELSEIKQDQSLRKTAIDMRERQESRLTKFKKQLKEQKAFDNDLVNSKQLILNWYKRLFDKYEYIQMQAICKQHNQQVNYQNSQIWKQAMAEIYQIQQQCKKNKIRDKFQSNLSIIKHKILLLNNCQGYVENTWEQLEKAQAIFLEFKQNYQKRMSIGTERLAQLYYLAGQTQTKMGKLHAAIQLVNNGVQIIEKLFDSQDNLLKTRKIPMNCYRLKAQIIGVFGRVQEQNTLYFQLKTRIQNLGKAIANPITKADICQAAAFVGIRSLPSVNLSQLSQLLSKSIESKSSVLGTGSQFLAIDYSLNMYLNWVKVQARGRSKDTEQFNKQYQVGKNVFSNIGKVMKREPSIYLYQMIFEESYSKICSTLTQQSSIQNQKIYVQNIEKYFEHKKIQDKDLQTSNIQKLYEVGKLLVFSQSLKQKSLGQRCLVKYFKNLKFLLKENSSLIDQKYKNKLVMGAKSLVQFYRAQGRDQQLRVLEGEIMEMRESGIMGMWGQGEGEREGEGEGEEGEGQFVVWVLDSFFGCFLGKGKKNKNQVFNGELTIHPLNREHI